MSYELRRSRKPTDTLTDEEWEVAQALKEYIWQPDQRLDFTPIMEMYNCYRRYVGRQAYRDPFTQTLSVRQFGAALQRIYPFDEEGPNPFKVRRTYHGKRVWGYLGLVGPLTIQSRDVCGKVPIGNKYVDDES